MAEPPANLIHRGIGRVEVFDFAPHRLLALHRFLSEGGQPFSIHAPLTRSRGSGQSALAVFFLSETPERREQSLGLVNETVAYARAWGAEYVVTHLNWSEDTDDPLTALRLAEESAAKLSIMAKGGEPKAGWEINAGEPSGGGPQAGGEMMPGREMKEVPIHMECGGYTGAFHQPKQFVALVSAFPTLGLCVDIGHAWLIAQARGRDFYHDLATLAPAARSAHLWNARDLATYRRLHHVPLHPSQRPEDGWIDIPRALRILLGASPGCRLIFEYREDDLPPVQIKEGFAWIEDLAARGASEQ